MDPDLRALVYDAALDRTVWDSALGAMSERVGAHIGALLMHDNRTGEGAGTAYGMPRERQGDYFAWNDNNPLLDRGRAWRGTFATDQDLLEKRDLVGSDFYHGFLKPWDMHAMLGVTLGRSDALFCSVNLMRSPGRGDYEREHAELAQSWVADLQRAFRISLKLAEADAMRAGAWDALDRQPQGVVLAEPDGRIVHMNAAAERETAHGDAVTALNGRLRAADRLRASALEAAMLRAGVGLGSSLWLRRRSAREPLAAHVVPTGRAGAWLLARPPAVLVLLCDPEAPGAPPERLQRLFGFTPAEAQVAARLMTGDTVQAAADHLAITRETARTHLKRIMAKAGVDRQAALVAKLIRSAELG